MCINASCRIRASSKPSKNGILMSLMSKSGCSFCTYSSASCPLPAVAATENSQLFPRDASQHAMQDLRLIVC